MSPRTSHALLIAFTLILTCVALQAQFDVPIDTPPRILGITPTSGPAGTVIQVGGTGFQEWATARIGLTGAPYNYISPFAATVVVPAGATSGRISITTSSGSSSSPELFVVTTSTAPSLTSFSPTSGRAGSQVTVSGAGFDTSAVVHFNGAAATTYFNSATSLTAIVPAAATSGPLRVTTANGSATSSQSFSVTTPAASITSFSPAAGRVGSVVAINGTALDGTTAVRFDGVAAAFILTGGIQIQATVPPNATTGPISVVTTGGTVTSSASFLVLTSEAPVITGFSPTSGRVGTSVTINGGNLDRVTNAGFHATSASSLTIVSATQVKATVPFGATSGPITVTSPDGTATSSAAFTVIPDPPTISGFSPLSGKEGDRLTVDGTNFDAGAVVAINGVAAATTFVSSTTVTATVPANAKSGPIRITTAGGSATSAQSFTVINVKPTISSYAPASGYPNTVVRITGTNLDTTSFVGFNGVSAEYTVGATYVDAIVPALAGSGPITVRTPYGEASTGLFTVLGSRPRVTVTSAFGEAPLQPGQVVTITWTSQASYGRILTANGVELSTDGGETFAGIAQLGGAARSLSWTVPFLPTVRGVIRVTARDAAGEGSDVSDGYFSIDGLAAEARAGTPRTVTTQPGGSVPFHGGVVCPKNSRPLVSDCTNLFLSVPASAKLKGFNIVPLHSTGCQANQVRTCAEGETGNCGSYRIDLATEPSIPVGEHPFVVSAQGTSSCTRFAPIETFILRVEPPSITVTAAPKSRNVIAGGKVTYHFTVKRFGYGGAFRLERANAPNDTVGFPQTTIAMPDSLPSKPNDAFGTDEFDMTVETVAPAPDVTPTPQGDLQLQINVIGDTVSNSTVIKLHVDFAPALWVTHEDPDFGLPGGRVQSIIRVFRYNYTGDFNVSLTKLPFPAENFTQTRRAAEDIYPGANRTRIDLDVLVPDGTSHVTGGYPFTITASPAVPFGIPEIQGRVRVKQVGTLEVDLATANDVPPAVRQVACVGYPLVVRRLDYESNQNVVVDLSLIPDPSTPLGSITPQLTPQTLTFAAPGEQAATLRLTLPAGTAPGNYLFRVKATDARLNVRGETGLIKLVVDPGPPQIPVIPDPLRIAVGPGGTARFFLTVQRTTNGCGVMYDGPIPALQVFPDVQVPTVRPVIEPDPMRPDRPRIVVTFPSDAAERTYTFPFRFDSTMLDVSTLPPSTNQVFVDLTNGTRITLFEPDCRIPRVGLEKIDVTWETRGAVAYHEVALVDVDGKVVLDPVRFNLGPGVPTVSVVIPNPAVATQLAARVAAFDSNGVKLAESTSCFFDVTPTAGPPRIDSVDPAGCVSFPGFDVTITGINFVPRGTKVLFSGVEGRIKSVTTTRIVVVVPSGAAGKPAEALIVRTDLGDAKGCGFRVRDDPPRVISVQPPEQQRGMDVTLTGTGFVRGDTRVLFGNVTVPADTVTDDKTLTVRVPLSAVGARLRVQTTFGTSLEPEGPIFTPLDGPP